MNKCYRLKSNASFSYIYKNGRSISSQIINIIYVKATNLKVGISVSRKVGNSVIRSLVKRRIKESFRLLIPYIKSPHSYNYVVVARPGIEKFDYHYISSELKRLLSGARHLSSIESTN
ncbi:MAG: ribonuclease P protein component [Christensenellaceae bacterium]|jgi:ribonuclease P protein component|nr:ribonuclease P protein component [Christensenellaceae bacterium]